MVQPLLENLTKRTNRRSVPCGKVSSQIPLELKVNKGRIAQ